MDDYIKKAYVLDEISGQYVLLVGFSIRGSRIFLRLFDGKGIYKREVFIKK